MIFYFLENNENLRFDTRELSSSRCDIDDAGLYCSLRFRIRNNSEVGRNGDAGVRGAVRMLMPEGVDEPEETGCSVGT